MATAVEPSSAPSAPGKVLSLPIASLIGAIYVLAALAAVFYALTGFWNDNLTPQIGANKSLDWSLWFVAITAGLLALGWFGLKLIGDNPPKGLRGGIFLMIATAFVIFFLVRAIAMSVEGSAGMIASAIIGIALLYFAVRFFTGRAGERWMVSLEEQGWFSLAQYKRSLGVRVRRLTILGILLVGGTGAYSLYVQGILPDRWMLRMPFDLPTLTVVKWATVAIPGILTLATLWIAFRAVNVPDFAEFLIATEAEMNKVSWSTRRRLMQDTIVVLLTTLIMTLFLLVVDLFWGWLLSRNTVGVLPSRATGHEKGQVHEAKW